MQVIGSGRELDRAEHDADEWRAGWRTNEASIMDCNFGPDGAGSGVE